MDRTDEMLSFALDVYEESQKRMDAYFEKKNNAEQTIDALKNKYNVASTEKADCSKWTQVDQRAYLKALKITTAGFWKAWRQQRAFIIQNQNMTI